MTTARAILAPLATWPGIYAITAPGLVYVGQTERAMQARWSEHWRRLAAGTHPNGALQAAWKATRGAGFDVAVLEIVTDARMLDARERWWIKAIGTANMRGRR